MQRLTQSLGAARRMARLDRATLLLAIQIPALLAALVPAPTWAEEKLITGVTAKATSEQVAGLFGAQNLCTDTGLSDAGRGDGSLRLTTDGYVGKGNCWHSGYIALGGDENAIVQFDLGRVATVGRFHVWNHNGSPHRGFKEVSLTCSDDGQRWRPVSQRFEFAKAPRSDDYLGEDYRFEPPLTARYIRFHCDATHRVGGNRELAGLGKVRFYEADPSDPAAPAKLGRLSEQFPAASGVIDLSAAPYLARGDGETDDTDAIQRAIHDWQGRHRILYLPAGTYRITRPLRYQPGVGHGYNTLLGAGRDKTILRLADRTFIQPGRPEPVLSLGFNGQPDGTGVHADWFNNNVAGLTIDTGRENPGAVGLEFYSNNVGSLRDVAIQSGDDQGAIGLDLGYADQNGPLLVQHVAIAGFAIGIRTGATVNSQTLEHVSITGATVAGLENRGQCLSIRGLAVSGPSPALVNHFGIVTLVEARLEGTAGAAELPAIASGETLFARQIKTKGFKLAIENRRTTDNPRPHAAGPDVDEWVSTPPLTLFAPSAAKSLHLPIEETPDVPADDPAAWANVRCFRELADPDDTAAFQRAIDSGAATVYFPAGSHSYLSQTVELRGAVRRVVGCFAGIHTVGELAAGLRVAEGESPIVVVQDLIGELSIDHAAPRQLVVKNGQGIGGVLRGGGKLFLDNVVGDWEFVRGQAWARQLNNERLGTHLSNRGAALWILGLKTERGGTLIETLAGGRTELLGGLSYTTNHGKLAPMFLVRDAAASITIGEVCYTGEPYAQLVQETRGAETRVLNRGEAPLRPSYLQGGQIPLFVGAADDPAAAPP